MGSDRGANRARVRSSAATSGADGDFRVAFTTPSIIPRRRERRSRATFELDMTPRRVLFASLVFLAACSASGRRPAAHHSAATYSSPFAYCRAVGTVDQPGARYTGPKSPPKVVRGLMKVMKVPSDPKLAKVFEASTVWRCMGGHVYACNVGANLPCNAKMNTSRTPNAGERSYCKSHANAAFIPKVATGHDTLYAWRCEGTKAVAGKAVGKLDARGYLARIWHRVPPSR